MKYKDCDIQTGLEKILKDFSEEPSQGYNTITEYQEKIVEFLCDHTNEDSYLELFNGSNVDELEGDLETCQNDLTDMENERDELETQVSELKAEIDCLERGVIDRDFFMKDTGMSNDDKCRIYPTKYTSDALNEDRKARLGLAYYNKGGNV